MCKKIVALLAVVAVMTVVLSVTAFAADSGSAELTNFGVITVLFEQLKITTQAFFGVIDKIYLFFANLFA